MIIAFPHPPGESGPGSFQSRFETILNSNGHRIVYPSDSVKPDVILVVGGTKRIVWLHRMRERGVNVIYRLDGINWLHRKTKVSIKKWLIAEYRNWNNKLIHAFFSDYIIYQSQFVQKWWDRKGLVERKDYSIIYNGVDIEHFRPKKTKNLGLRLVCLEGTIDYSPYAVELINQLRSRLSFDIKMELYGRFEKSNSIKLLHSSIDYRGSVARE